MTDYSGLIEERLSNAQLAAAVAILTAAGKAFDEAGDGDKTPMIDEVITKAEEQLANYTDNMNRLIAGLKEKRDAARSTKES